MSGLLHLVEAATALTQLGPSNLSPSTAYQAMSSASSVSSASLLPAFATTSYSPRASTHTISDDDDNFANNASAKMAALRENHLIALRAAATNAAVQPVPVAAATVYHVDQQVVNQKVMSHQAMAPPPAQYTVDQAAYPQATPITSTPPRSDSTKEMFPMRLHALLGDSQVRTVISWLPHGKSFVVLRPDVFATNILPRYFAPEGSNSLNAKTIPKVTQGVHKYPSFTRKLNRWGFRQISRGSDAGAFCHEFFQRDFPDLCRRMVCQKSRKLKKGGMHDDTMSVSSASTMGTKSVASCEKRPYSSTVTVSTAGGTSDKSLPLKKRKSGQHLTDELMMNGIPFVISHRQQKMAESTTSMTETNLTSHGGPPGPLSVSPKVAGNVANQTFQVAVPVKAAASVNNSTFQVAESAAKDALARHFHEQQRAFALASLMANSHLAMEAAGLKNEANAASVAAASTTQGISSGECTQNYIPIPVLGAITTKSPSVIAHTVSVPEDKKMPSTASASAAPTSAADAAKSALYKAYLQALSGHTSSSSS